MSGSSPRDPAKPLILSRRVCRRPRRLALRNSTRILRSREAGCLRSRSGGAPRAGVGQNPRHFRLSLRRTPLTGGAEGSAPRLQGFPLPARLKPLLKGGVMPPPLPEAVSEDPCRSSRCRRSRLETIQLPLCQGQNRSKRVLLSARSSWK